jgi:DNA-binding beta-propeller fold protein YncE
MKRLLVLAASFFLIELTNGLATEGQYSFLKEIPIGGAGGWDCLSIDPAAHRLYVTHATKIVVIDTEKEVVVGEIDGTPGVHAFALAPELGRGFSSNGKEAKVSIVNLKTLKTEMQVPTGENPDAILYDSDKQEVYAFNGQSKSATVFEAKTGKVVTEIPLPGKPEFAAADERVGLIYCNLEDKSTIAVIDTQTHQLTETWPVAPGKEPTGLALDLAHHRLFSGCGNETMVMIDSTNGRFVGSVPTGKHCDGVAFDPGNQLAFSSNGEGTVTIAHEASPEKIEMVQLLKTERGARTMVLDPITRKIYLPTAKFEPAPENSTDRPKIVDGTMKLLVYGPAG